MKFTNTEGKDSDNFQYFYKRYNNFFSYKMADEEKIDHISKKFKCDQESLPSSTQNVIKVGYNRCRNPLRTTERCKTINLRKPSLALVEAFNAKHKITPILTTSDRLCYKCKTKIEEMCQSSQDTSSQSKSFKK